MLMLLGLVDLVGWIAVGGLLIAAVNFGYVMFWHAVTPVTQQRASQGIADYPHVLVQIPTFNEARVVTDAARAVVGLDWPRDRLHIQILDDSTNTTTEIAREVVSGLRAQGHDIVLLHRGNRAGFKAGALAAGLTANNAPYVAVLDADFRAPADWLRVTLEILVNQPDIAFVQSRCDYRNGDANTLTRVQRLMQDAHYIVEQAARHARGVPFQCNGTGTVWRRVAMDQAGGWSGETLSEDLDLGLRVFLQGWQARLLLMPAVMGELPETVCDWQVQQNRWSSGFLQVARKLLPALWRSSLRLEAKISVSLMILMQLVFPCLVVAGFSIAAGGVLRGSFAYYWDILMVGGAVGLVILLGVTWPAYHFLRRGSIGRYLTIVASMPVLMARLAVANSLGILGAAFGQRRIFQVTPKRGI